MILLDISGADATLRKQDTLTCGMVGAKVRFRFNEAWDGLTKTAVFRCGKVTRDCLLTGDTAVIPHEALTAPGMPLQIGVYGADGGGALVIPTLWAATCPVRPGADPSGDTGADPTLPVWAEIRAKAETNGQNIGDLTGQVDALRRQAADTIVPPPIVETAAGMTVSAPDSAERPLQGLTLYGRTTQDGTPTPGAPVALESVGGSGTINTTVAGKNLLPPGSASNGCFTADGKGGYTATDKTGTLVIGEVTLEAGKTYTLSASAKGDVINPCILIRKPDEITNIKHNYSNSSLPVTYMPTETQTVKILLQTEGAKGRCPSGVTFYIQLEIGSTATAYEPYKEPQTLLVSTPDGLPGIPVTSGGNHTDENGQQWVCDEIDFARGVYVKNIGMYSGTVHTNTTVSSGGLGWVDIPDIYIPKGNALCDIAPFSRSGGWAATTPMLCINDDKYARLYGDMDTDYTLRILYPREAPIETALSADELAGFAALHTNKPNTIVFNDSGAGMKLSYVADTKIYIDNRFTQLQNAILSAGANI